MKEIHATQNIDGTFLVVIKDLYESEKVIGKSMQRNTSECVMTIPRASISITPYSSKDEGNENLIFKLDVDD